MQANNNKDPYEDLLISIGIGIVVCLVLIVINIFSTTVHAGTVSGNDSSVSGDTLPAYEQTVVSSNYTSGNTLSGPMTYDQGDRIIHLLYLVLFIMIFSWCHERIRNGVRSLKNTR